MSLHFCLMDPLSWHQDSKLVFNLRQGERWKTERPFLLKTVHLNISGCVVCGLFFIPSPFHKHSSSSCAIDHSLVVSSQKISKAFHTCLGDFLIIMGHWGRCPGKLFNGGSKSKLKLTKNPSNTQPQTHPNCVEHIMKIVSHLLPQSSHWWSV